MKIACAIVRNPQNLVDREPFSLLIIHTWKNLFSVVYGKGLFNVGVCPDAVNKEVPKKNGNHGQG